MAQNCFVTCITVTSSFPQYTFHLLLYGTKRIADIKQTVWVQQKIESVILSPRATVILVRHSTHRNCFYNR